MRIEDRTSIHMDLVRQIESGLEKCGCYKGQTRLVGYLLRLKFGLLSQDEKAIIKKSGIRIPRDSSYEIPRWVMADSLGYSVRHIQRILTSLRVKLGSEWVLRRWGLNRWGEWAIQRSLYRVDKLISTVMSLLTTEQSQTSSGMKGVGCKCSKTKELQPSKIIKELPEKKIEPKNSKLFENQNSKELGVNDTKEGAGAPWPFCRYFVRYAHLRNVQKGSIFKESIIYKLKRQGLYPRVAAKLSYLPTALLLDGLNAAIRRKDTIRKRGEEIKSHGAIVYWCIKQQLERWGTSMGFETGYVFKPIRGEWNKTKEN